MGTFYFIKNTRYLLKQEGHESDLDTLLLAIHQGSKEFGMHIVGYSQDDLGDILGLHQGGQIPAGADDGQPFDDLALLSRVIVNVANQLVVRPPLLPDSLGDSLAC